jgi:hypothetical protein
MKRSSRLQTYCQKTLDLIICKPAGMLPYHYITPSMQLHADTDREAGNYAQQYDWDTYFIGVAMSQIAPHQLPYFKEALLNFLLFTTPSGRTPRTISPLRIWDPFDQHKPFLAQGALLVSKSLGDVTWLAGWAWEKLVAFVSFWEETRGFHGLARWRSALEAGPDNNPTINHLEPYQAESIDVNAYLLREYEAMDKLSTLMNAQDNTWSKKAEQLKTRMQAFWNEKDHMFYDILNFSDQDVEHIPVSSWTCFTILWAGAATDKQAKAIVKKHLMNENEFLSPHGIRSIPISNPIYNTAKRYQMYEISEKRRRVISNWQGPVWVVANWIITQGLMKYGMKTEANEIADRVLQTLEQDLQDTGTLHENYHPETGEGLWSPNFGSWNLLASSWKATLRG